MNRFQLIAIGLLFAVAPTLQAQEAGISVTGTAEVKVKPTHAEIKFKVSGSGELAADAILKYQTAHKQLTKAINDLKLGNVTVDLEGIAVGGESTNNAFAQAMVVAGGAAQPEKKTTAVHNTLRVMIGGLDKKDDGELISTLSRVVDAAKDAGAALDVPNENMQAMMMRQMLGQGSQTEGVLFVAAVDGKLREEAYRLAFEQAHRRAQRLADLAGVKLGRVRTISEMGNISDKASNNPAAWMMSLYGLTESDNKPRRLTSRTFTEIPVRVSLAVRFDIEEK